MRYLTCILLLGTAYAQQAPIGIVRGELITWQAVAAGGQLNIRTNDGHTYECSYDGKTYFERDNQRVAAGVLSTGDRLEIVSDHKPGSQNCYARTVHVMDPPTVRIVPGVRPRLEAPVNSTESFAPRGDMTFSGVVIRIDPDALTLKMRTGDEKIILLRQDTRYLGDGQRVDAGGLKRNTRVFIRAGRNLDNDVEAYQVIWGNIIRPND